MPKTGNEIGDLAPDFVLKDASGEEWKLSARRGKTVVLLFYPGDNTPICTKQLCAVRDDWKDFETTGADVIGISTDSIDSHKKFGEKHRLPLRLLADANGEVTRLFDVKSWLPKRAARAVVIIDKNGIVSYRKIQPLSIMQPKNSDILEAIRAAEN